MQTPLQAAGIHAQWDERCGCIRCHFFWVQPILRSCGSCLQAAPEGTGSESGGEGGGEAASGKVGPADFELLRVVGQGAFGKARPHSVFHYWVVTSSECTS